MADKEYIERGAVLEAITYNPIVKSTVPDVIDRTLAVVHKYIRKVPAADVEEVRYSSWKLIEYSFGDTATIICGDCHFQKQIKEERRDFKSVLPKYCENCGARMDGERKEQNGV